MAYTGKHGRLGAAGSTGSGRRRGRVSYDRYRYPIPRQPGWSDDSWPDCSLDSLESLGSSDTSLGSSGPEDALSDISADLLEAEDSRDDDGSHRHLRYLLGSIPVRGIRLQSPIYIERSRRSAPQAEPGTPGSSVTTPGSSVTTPGSSVTRPERARWRDDTIPLMKAD